jgi:RHS repeat-associated protein
MNIAHQYDAASHKFTGKERDTESGLHNFWARYGASNFGRFMSPDPVFMHALRVIDPQRLNLYAYARNNPKLMAHGINDAGLARS